MKILIVSDTHVGSMSGLMPPKVKLYHPAGEKAFAVATTNQLKLYKAWEQMVDDVGGVDMVFHLGDVVDGKQPKEEGMGLWSTRIKDQVDAAVQLLKMVKFRGKPEYVLAEGTPYHTDRNPNADRLVAEELGCGGNHYGPEVRIDIDGYKIHMAHKIGVSTAAYRSTAMNRELVMDQMTASLKGTTYDLILRGHCHYYVEVGGFRARGRTVPCWQFRTSYMAALGLGVQPELGYLVLSDEEGGGWTIEAHQIPLTSPIREVKK